jgi:hypothetical protein
VLNHLKSHTPTAEVVEYPAEDHASRSYPLYRQMLLFGLTNEYAAPLPFLEDLKLFDPLTALTHRMDLVDPARDERIRYRLMVLVPSAQARSRAAQRLIHGTVSPTSGIHRNPDDPLAGFDEKLLNAKLDDHLYHAFLSVMVESREEGRLAVLSQIIEDVKLFNAPHHNAIDTVGLSTFR